MKKTLILLLTTAMITSTLSGCSANQTATTNSTETAATTEEQTPAQGGAPPQLDAATQENAKKMNDNFPFFAYNGDNFIPHEFHNVDNGTKVYMTTDISSEGLEKIYKALGKPMTGKVAVKISTGEAGDEYYLHPDLIKGLVQSVNGTIVECNTAYAGSRSETAMHRQLIEDHGFTSIANVDIMDEDGSLSIPVNGGTHLKEDIVGSHLANYNSMIVLSHFKGHPQGGFGGAIKNMSIGIASANGKVNIHSGGKATSGQLDFSWDIDSFLSSMAEASKGVRDYMGKDNVIYISVMNNLSIDCDCVSNPTKPDMHDIGILASTDPVALDQACIDQIYSSKDDNKTLIYRMESRNGFMTLKHAAEIGLGSRDYTIENID